MNKNFYLNNLLLILISSNNNLYKPIILSQIMEKDIGKIPKNEQTDILIRVDDFGGRVGITIREFVNSEKYTGFTKAGTRIPADHFLKFREMINSIDLEDLKPSDSEQKPASKKPQKKLTDDEMPDY